ncbi:hypothetical protein Tsubulata_007253 [Turnera subulata]|uniref:Uncharacterized protein n=1 Tax=Turnera subulata TaxID=218843 RepID=A0A9Q0GGM9_9ROSI|nr:hypothetical protein Tsubulata_007253 [Turnera subulata]
MDDTLKESPPDTKPKSSSRFLRCFGVSGKPKEKPMKVVVEPGEGKRKKQWFSWSKFRIKNSSTKTVPVDSTTGIIPDGKVKSSSSSDKAHGSKSSKPKRKAEKVITTKHQIPVSSRKEPHQVPARVSSDKTTSKEVHQETWHGSEQDIILENGKPLDHVDTPKGSTSLRRLSFCRKIDAIRTGSSSRPGSPEPRTKSIRTVSVTPRAVSVPTPKPILEKPALLSTQPVNSRVVTVRKEKKENEAAGNQLDPIIGLSILLVTLIIMVLWGRVCAILCTSAWFYFIPRIRTGADQDTPKNGSAEPNFDSEEYKKKVVLEGLLERKRRSKPSI